jgi:WD40 repeat protein
MNRASFFDRLFAVLMLAIGILCFARVCVAPGGELFGGLLTSGGISDTPLSSAVGLAVFLAGGIVCAAGAWWLWTGRSANPSRQTSSREIPLFGRRGGIRPAGSSGLRQFLLAFPFIAIVALAVDQFGLWRTPQGSGIQEPLTSAEAEPEPAPAEPQDDESGMTPVTSTGPTAVPTPVPDAAPALPAGPVASPQQTGQNETGNETPWPELVLAPGLASPPEITAPVASPQTVAPLPLPEPRQTQPGGHHDAVVWLAVSPDGRSIMSASTDRTIKLWDIDGNRLIRDVGAHKDMTRSALFLPDGARALTAGDDGEIVLRSLADGAVLHVFSATEHGGANKLALSVDGRRAVSVHEAGTVIVWDIENRTVRHVLSGHDWSISGVAVSPDGQRAISGSIDGTLKLWDIDAGSLMRTWLGHDRGAYGAAFTADGRHAITGSGDYTIKLWDLEAGREIRRFERHSGTVYAVAISDDGKRILSGSLDGTARVWDMDTGNEIVQFSGHSGPIYAVAFGAHDTVLTGGGDRAIRVWPAGGGEAVALFAGAPE